MRIGWNAQDDVDADEKRDHADGARYDSTYEPARGRAGGGM